MPLGSGVFVKADMIRDVFHIAENAFEFSGQRFPALGELFRRHGPCHALQAPTQRFKWFINRFPFLHTGHEPGEFTLFEISVLNPFPGCGLVEGGQGFFHHQIRGP